MILNFYTISAFINFATSFLMAVFVILKNKKDPKNIIFFIFASLVGLWSLGYFFWQNVSNNYDLALFLARALIFFAIMIAPAYLHFSFAITEDIKKHKKTIIAAYIIFGLFALSDLTPYFIEKLQPMLGFEYWPVASPLLITYLFFFAALVGYAFFTLIKKYKTSAGLMKLQIKYVAIGTIISMISGSVNFLPWFKISFSPLTNALVPVYVVLMASAIVRYKLMDIKIIIKNILFYFGIAFSLYALFYILAFFYELAFGDALAKSGYFFGLFIAPLLAIIMYRGSNFLSHLIDKFVLYNQYSQKQVLKESAQKLSRYSDINGVADIVINSIKKALKPEGAAFLFLKNDGGVNQFKEIKAYSSTDKNSALDFNLYAEYFKNEEKPLTAESMDKIMKEDIYESLRPAVEAIKNEFKKYNMAVCLPLTNNGLLAGLITLGPRSEEDYYGKEDLEFLETLLGHAQTAVDNALLYKKIEEKNLYLQELISEKDDFLRIANHQLNTPLSIMKNAYSMVKDGSLTIKKGLYYWESGIESMSRIMKGFWSALQDEEIKTAPQKTDLLQMSRNALGKKRKDLFLLKKDIGIQLDKPNFKMPFAWCDRDQIEQVLDNLLNNAISYTPKGKIILKFELDKTAGIIKTIIKDTGIGFEKEEESKITKKFYRTSQAILAHPDGSGLGLYICKKLLDINKGDLFYGSEGRNKGASFSFALPIYKNQL